MPRKLAVKRLTVSDLTFFKWHFDNNNAGNQKGINMNANVFVDELFPSLTELTKEKYLFDLSIYGPGLAGEQKLPRKFIKGSSYKNWRLNGEFVIGDPEDRYSDLTVGDYVIFEFIGQPEPVGVGAVFVARGIHEDANLHEEISVFLAQRKMAVMSEDELLEIVNKASPAPEHPIRILLIEQDLEDAANNDLGAINRLLSFRRVRTVSKDDLQAAKWNADRIGMAGEEFVNSYLTKRVRLGEILDFEWASRKNAIEPYDFLVTGIDGAKIYVEAKSTSGKFERSFHVSLNELNKMAKVLQSERYDIYRVFNIDGENASLRVAEGVSVWATEVRKSLSGLRQGIQVDSMSVTCSAITLWTDELEITLETEEDEAGEA